jgi:FMN phosphatase YigB (HAD superfamily)
MNNKTSCSHDLWALKKFLLQKIPIQKKCPKKCKLVIFDMDGTLYENNTDIIKAYSDAAADLISEIDNISFVSASKKLETVKNNMTCKMGGRPTSTLALLKHWKADFKKYEVLVNSMQNIESLLQADQMALETIKKIKNKKKIHLFTTNNSTSAARIIKAIGMESLFPENIRFTVSDIWKMSCLGTDEKTEFIKPGLRGFEHILNIHGFKPEQALMVGDSRVSDIMPALSLNMGAYEIQNMESLYNLPDFMGF